MTEEIEIPKGYRSSRPEANKWIMSLPAKGLGEYLTQGLMDSLPDGGMRDATVASFKDEIKGQTADRIREITMYYCDGGENRDKYE